MSFDPDARIFYTTVDGIEQPLPEGCQWFAGCDNFANGVRPHPAFAGGGVPICKRCNDKVERLES
jgi:hypothetical protein